MSTSETTVKALWVLFTFLSLSSPVVPEGDGGGGTEEEGRRRVIQKKKKKKPAPSGRHVNKTCFYFGR